MVTALTLASTVAVAAATVVLVVLTGRRAHEGQAPRYTRLWVSIPGRKGTRSWSLVRCSTRKTGERLRYG